MMQYIKQEFKGRIGILTFDNDKKSNSLNLQMLDELVEAMNGFKEQGMRVVIIRSNPGAKVWCAGLRIDQLPEAGRDPIPYEYTLEKALRAVERFPGAVIALIEGGVWGGGCELAFSCDILLGSPESTFAITPAKIGAPYNPNQVNRVLQRIGSNIAMEMFFTANRIDAARAKELGILNHLFEKDDLDKMSMKIANKIVNNAPLTIALLKKQIHDLGSKTVEQLTRDEASRTSIRRVYESDDFKEGKLAFIEKRKPLFNGK